ncbi:MAG: Na+/H+ antiporter subunit E [Hyphomicrobiales bacterium]
MSAASAERARSGGSFLIRMAAYMSFWIVLAGTGTKDLVVGVPTAAVAAWLSLLLLPPGHLAVRPARLAQLFLRFILQSVVAGLAVARIALSPAMPLKPGIVAYKTGLAPGTRRYAFMTFASLLPGTLPLGTDESDEIPVHCLDIDQAVALQLAQEEDRLRSVFSEGAVP